MANGERKVPIMVGLTLGLVGLGMLTAAWFTGKRQLNILKTGRQSPRR
jgi:hypothetical protein